MALNGNGTTAIKVAFITAFAALLVSIGGNLTVYLDGKAARADARQARAERVVRENQFFRSQCFRDKTFSFVIIGALKDAVRRAKVSIADPLERERAIFAIERSIAQLKIIAGACENQIPD